MFSPGYQPGRRPPEARTTAGQHTQPVPRYGWADGAKGPVQGFPPTPGQPPPLYPPGQFSAWNRAPHADGSTGDTGEFRVSWPADGHDEPGQGYPGWDQHADAGPGHPALAVSDPAAYVAPAGTAGDYGTVADPGSPGPPGPPSPPGPARRGMGGRRGNRSTPRRRRRIVWIVASCLLACVVLGAGAYAWEKTRHNGTGALPPAGQTTSPPTSPKPTPSPTPKPPPGAWRFIGTRTSDPAPLVAGQLFPLRFSATGPYTRTVDRTGKKCAAAIVGSRLQAAVGHAGCTQVLRASYVSAKKKQMGTIGVLNLKSFSAAEKAGKSAGAAQFIRPLDAPKGLTHSLSKATGLEEAEVKGHYLILVLADRTDLRAPKSKAQRRALETFMSNLIKQTVNVSLTTRMVTGKP